MELDKAVSELRVSKKALEEREKALVPQEESFNRAGLEDLLKRRFFYAPAFSIYGGQTGLSLSHTKLLPVCVHRSSALAVPQVLPGCTTTAPWAVP